jgi:hypothetical protein
MACKGTLVALFVVLSALLNISIPFALAQESHQIAPTASSKTPCGITQPVRAEPPRDPNADRFGFGPWYVNADRTMWAGWDVGNWVSGGAGNKVLWIRPQDTQLKVTGRSPRQPEVVR